MHPTPVYIVSGGAGASGEQIVHTVLAQFPDVQVPVIKVAQVRQIEQIEDVVAQASVTGGTIVHTLVDDRLRRTLNRSAEEEGATAIDLVGPLMIRLADVLGREPLGQPGLYRLLHQVYFDRVAAIEFSMSHDDGQYPQDLSSAEIVLAGVSRVGKTPLSMYLSVLGWKVSNVPLILGHPPPAELFQIDRHRVIGLNMDPELLLLHRKKRQRRMGTSAPITYTRLATIYEELESARGVFRRGGFSVVNVNNKPIETSAAEIIELITGWFKTDSRRS